MSSAGSRGTPSFGSVETGDNSARPVEVGNGDPSSSVGGADIQQSPSTGVRAAVDNSVEVTSPLPVPPPPPSSSSSSSSSSSVNPSATSNSTSTSASNPATTNVTNSRSSTASAMTATAAATATATTTTTTTTTTTSTSTGTSAISSSPPPVAALVPAASETLHEAQGIQVAKDEEFSTKIDTESDKKQKIRFGTTGFTIKVEFQWIMKPSDCCGDDNSFPRARIYGYADEESWSPGVYEGEVNERGIPHGKGRMEEGPGSLQKSGSVSSRGENQGSVRRTYTGSFLRGQRSGFGELTWAGSGKSYIGFWRECRMHGYGTERRPPSKPGEQGDVYSGMWAHGKRSGLGVRRWHEGQRYAGTWSRNRMEGHGAFAWPSGLVYLGTWKEHKRSGHGIEVLESNDEGDAQSSMYAGDWKLGKRHGQGMRVKQGNAKVWGGRFKEGRRVKAEKAAHNNSSVESVISSSQEALRASEVAREKSILAQELVGRELLRGLEVADTEESISKVLEILGSRAEELPVAMPLWRAKKSLMEEGRATTADGGEGWSRDVSCLLVTKELVETAKKKRDCGRWSRDIAKQFGALLRTSKAHAETVRGELASSQTKVREKISTMAAEL